MKKKQRKISSLNEGAKIIFLFTMLLFLVFPIYGQEVWTQVDLSQGRRNSVATLGTKVYLAGGNICNSTMTTLVEIYDVKTEIWDPSENLSVARAGLAGESSSNKVFFAGGYIYFPEISFFSEIDIFDTTTSTWDTQHLSVPRVTTAVSKDDIVLFAGGFTSAWGTTDVVDIYNDGIWTTATLSEPRYVGAAVVVGDLAMFAGGVDLPNVTKRIDIYNFSTGEWTIDSFSVARGNLAGTVIGNKAFFAGGMTSDNNTSDIVDIYDYSTEMWSTANLSFARAFSGGVAPNAATVCEKAFFVNGGKLDLNSNAWLSMFDIIDIYDSVGDTWTTGFLPNQSHRTNHYVVGVDDKLIVSGGNPCGKAVDILEGIVCGIPPQKYKSDYSIFPNPAKEKLNVNASFENKTSGTLQLYDVSGHTVYQYKFNDNLLSHQIDLKPWNPGLYVVEISTENGKIIEKVMVLD